MHTVDVDPVSRCVCRPDARADRRHPSCGSRPVGCCENPSCGYPPHAFRPTATWRGACGACRTRSYSRSGSNALCFATAASPRIGNTRLHSGAARFGPRLAH